MSKLTKLTWRAGNALIGIAAFFWALGMAGIWWRRGFFALLVTLSPFNLAGWLATAAIFAPGLLLVIAAKRCDPRVDTDD